jgi:hypothetical protein
MLECHKVRIRKNVLQKIQKICIFTFWGQFNYIGIIILQLYAGAKNN